MIRFVLHHMLRRFEAEFDYDASYMHQVVKAWPGAGLRYVFLSVFSNTRGEAPAVWGGALLASTLDGDCGPCAQLVADMAVKSGCPPDQIAACLARDFDAAGATGLGFRFSEAAIRDLPEIEGLRTEIITVHGDRAAISAAYAAASGRAFPVLKRAMGHGQSCQQIKLGGVLHPVVRQAG